MEALYNAPQKPFFSENSSCFSRGIDLKYAQVHMTNSPNTISPSNE